MNKDKWMQISEKDRAAIMAISGEKLSAKMGSLWHKNDIAARKQLKSRLGDDYSVADDKLLSSIQHAFEPLQTAWMEKATKQGVKGEEALLFYKAQTEAAAEEITVSAK